MKAKIYKPVKSTMQSGRGTLDQWVLEYELETPRTPEPLMGWVSAEDTLNQVQMRFDSREAAQAFAESKGIEYTVITEHKRKVVPRSYLDNFKYLPAEEDDGV